MYIYYIDFQHLYVIQNKTYIAIINRLLICLQSYQKKFAQEELW